MVVAIMSDSHDHIEKLETALVILRTYQVAHIIHCGDMVAPSVMNWLAGHFEGVIHYVFGNNEDRYLMTKLIEEQLAPHVVLYGDRGKVELDGVKFAFNHFPDVAEDEVATGKYDVVCYGHIHKYRAEQRGNTLLVNPGTVGGLFAEPTLVCYDTAMRECVRHDL